VTTVLPTPTAFIRELDPVGSNVPTIDPLLKLII